MGKGGCKVFKSNRQEYDELSSYRSRANEVFFEAPKPPSHWGGGGKYSFNHNGVAAET